MVLIHVGVTSVIAHIKIGQMHAALESKVLVVSAQGQCATAAGAGRGPHVHKRRSGEAQCCSSGAKERQ